MQHHTSCACSVCQDHLRKVVTLQLFSINNGILTESENGGFVQLVDVLRVEIEMAQQDKATAVSRIRFLKAKLKELL